MPAENKVSLEPKKPSQLGQLMQVASPTYWLSLLALCILLAAAAAWGFYGSIPTKVSGLGILLYPKGILEVFSPGNGRIKKITVKLGGQVKKGQVVALISQPDLEAKIRTAEVKIQALQAREQELSKYYEGYLDSQNSYQKAHQAELESSLRHAQERKKWLQKQVDQQSVLFKDGLITEQDLLQTKQQLQDAEESIRKTQSELKQQDSQTKDLENKKISDLFEIHLQVLETQNQLELDLEEFETTSKVISEYDGEVTLINLRAGDEISQGAALMQLLEPENEIEARVYIQAQQGKRVNTGMGIQVTPTTVKQEEYGYIVGRVMKVETLPETKQGMLDYLGDENLVNSFSSDGPVIGIQASLEKDPKTASGFKWSSRQGPPFKISVGTLCSASVVVQEQPPITLVVPLIKEWLGVD